MGWRTGPNAPLGCPDPNVAHSTSQGFPLGSVINAYDSDTETNAELMWVVTGADHVVGEDVDVVTGGTFATSDATADTGTADAIVASSSGEYVWVKLKTRQPLS